MSTPPALHSVVADLQQRQIALPEAVVRLDAFGDSAAMSEQLLALIISGRKRGGAALLWAYEAEGEALPKPGDIAIVLDFQQQARLITRVTEVVVAAFLSVTPAFAAREGEGDGSLAYWRTEHWAYFSRECQRLGREPHQQMPVVCESFEVLRVLPTPLPAPPAV